MTIDRRLLAGALGVSLILAACGGSSAASSTPAPAGSQAAATEAPGTPEPTEVPTATEEATNGTEPSFVAGAASDLEAMLPSEAAGVRFEKTSFDGASLGLLGAGVDTEELDPILKANGKTISDVRVAIATQADSTATGTGMVIAFQIKGVEATRFMDAVGADTASMTTTKIGGKQVLHTGGAGFSFIIYTKGDILFEILLATDEIAESILQQLP